MTRIRVVYREVSHDLADGSLSFGPEESVDIDVDAVEDTLVRGTTDDGREVVAFRGGLKQVRARPAGSDRTYRTLLGYRQRFEDVDENRRVEA